MRRRRKTDPKRSYNDVPHRYTMTFGDEDRVKQVALQFERFMTSSLETQYVDCFSDRGGHRRDAPGAHCRAARCALHAKRRQRRREGIDRIVVDLIARCQQDPRIADIFKGQDLVRLHRTLVEQICYISGGPCHYSGRDMASAHKDMGLQNHDFNALVEDLQAAMDREGVAFADQNRLLAKLAPMQRTTVDHPPKL
jgi:truncated hemoglobin YjbI